MRRRNAQLKEVVLTIVESIENRADEPKTVFFGYCAPVDGQRVDGAPEIEEVIKRVGSREVPWADALPALAALSSKPAPIVRIDTTEHTICVGNDGDGWRILDVKRRPGPR